MTCYAGFIRISIREAKFADTEIIAEFNNRMALETEHRGLDVVHGVAALLADPGKGRMDASNEIAGRTHHQIGFKRTNYELFELEFSKKCRAEALHDRPAAQPHSRH